MSGGYCRGRPVCVRTLEFCIPAGFETRASSSLSLPLARVITYSDAEWYNLGIGTVRVPGKGGEIEGCVFPHMRRVHFA
jgi:hypothetical protein